MAKKPQLTRVKTKIYDENTDNPKTAYYVDINNYFHITVPFNNFKSLSKYIDEKLANPQNTMKTDGKSIKFDVYISKAELSKFDAIIREVKWKIKCTGNIGLTYGESMATNGEKLYRVKIVFDCNYVDDINNLKNIAHIGDGGVLRSIRISNVCRLRIYKIGDRYFTHIVASGFCYTDVNIDDLSVNFTKQNTKIYDPVYYSDISKIKNAYKPFMEQKKKNYDHNIAIIV